MADKKKLDENLVILKKPDTKTSPSGRIIQVFLNTNMSKGHPGLTELCQRNNIDVKKLKDGEYVLFVNRRHSFLKIFTSNNVIAAHKSPNGRIEMQALHKIPGCFKGSVDFSMDQALRMVLEEIFQKRSMVRRKQANDGLLVAQRLKD